MSEFYIPVRYNNTIAEKGRWFDVYDESGQLHGRFLVSLIASDAGHTKLRAQRLSQGPKGAKVGQASPEETRKATAEMLVELAVRDWKDVLNAKREQVPFSRDKAVAYFMANEYATEQVYAFAIGVLNFQGATVEEIEKN